jgi:predicted lysophospholipase L1 biosynthesis ABC-type transport system permease subunit
VGHAVRFRDDVDLATARADLEEDFPRTVVGPMRPLDVSALDRVRGIPFVVAGLLGAMALVSVAVTLTTASRRRRRDLAVLRSVGLARGQVRRLFAGESTAFVLAALVVGVPLGVAAGRVAWTLAADGLGSALDPNVPLLGLAAGAAAVLALVNLYGQWLALVVGRRRPGQDLRSE